ncbi:MAG: hypothetical protein R3Y53_08905 [Bacillota bacterium]
MSENQQKEPDRFNSQQALLGQLLGGQNGDTEAMMERMQRMSKLFRSPQAPSDSQAPNLAMPRQNKGIEHMLYAALPYIDAPFQKHMLMMSKVFEIQRVMGQREEDVIMEAREKVENPAERRMQMLQAIQPFLQDGERDQLSQMMKMVQMKDIFSMRESAE